MTKSIDCEVLIIKRGTIGIRDQTEKIGIRRVRIRKGKLPHQSTGFQSRFHLGGGEHDILGHPARPGISIQWITACTHLIPVGKPIIIRICIQVTRTHGRLLCLCQSVPILILLRIIKDLDCKILLHRATIGACRPHRDVTGGILFIVKNQGSHQPVPIDEKTPSPIAHQSVTWIHQSF